MGASSSFAIGQSPSPAEVEALAGSLRSWCRPLQLEVTPPFLVGWYNDKRTEKGEGMNLIEAPRDTVAFAIYSVPGYVDVITEHFARSKPETKLVDSATDEILSWLRLPPDVDALVVNTDVGPPYYHVQTVGAVCGIDEHIEAEDLQEAGDDEWREELMDQLGETRDALTWGTDPVGRRKIFGVNVHPVYGGWYAYRALVILRGVSVPGLTPPAPLEFLEHSKKRLILAEYNLQHAMCLWRDLTEDHPPARRYCPDEYLFFTETSPDKRRRFLEIRAAHLGPTPPGPRVATGA